MHYINNSIKNRVVLYSLILLFGTIAIYSCCKEKNHVVNIGFIRSADFSKDDFGKGTFNLYYFSNNKNFIINYNKTTSTIIFNNLNSRLSTKIPFKHPINFRMIFVKSEDSIFLISREESKIYLIDYFGNIVNNYPVNLFKAGVRQKIVANEPDWITISKGKLYINSYPSYKNRKTPYHKNFFCISIDLVTKKTELIPITYPKIYSNNHWWGGLGNKLTQCENNKGEIVFSFAMCDSLYFWDGQHIKGYKVKRSKYLTDFPPDLFDNNKGMSSKYVIEYQRMNPRYSAILFDNRLKIYYRVVAHSQSLKNKQGYNNLNYDRSWSVQIIDTNLKVIDELYFDAGKYIYSDFLITKEGFCVSRHNTDSDSLIHWDFYKVIKL